MPAWLQARMPIAAGLVDEIEEEKQKAAQRG
jgi:hypothetical protein